MNTPVSLSIDKLLLEKNIDTPVVTTIADVVMWLYEKHGIWICISKIPFEKHFMFEYSISNNDCLKQDGVFDSPTKAYEAAIEYALNNLI